MIEKKAFRKVRIGSITADMITMSEAVEVINQLAYLKKGGFIVTPNVDHVVIADKNKALRAAYEDASLSLVDGMPLLWATRILGTPLPEKVSGSDLVYPVLVRAAQAGLSTYFLGAAPGVGIRAAEVLTNNIPKLKIVGIDAPPVGFEQDKEKEKAVFERMLYVQPDIVLVALGCPKQELLMHRWSKKGITPVMLGIGASLDFISGTVKRAPSWMSAFGLEWIYRLIQDPRRLAKRYLVHDMVIIKILYKMLMQNSRKAPI